MNLRKIILAMCITGLAGCGTSEPTTPGRFVDIDGVTVSWKDLREISNTNLENVPLGAGESVYLVSAASATNVQLAEFENASSTSDCLRVSSNYTGGYPVLNQEKYRICEQRLRTAKSKVKQPHFSELLVLTERAVEREGTCEWDGYDKSFDLRVRIATSAARLDDDRLFFTKMKCVN